jgi:hypothetical protein
MEWHRLLAYLTYTPALDTASYANVQQAFDQQLGAALLADQFSPTGRAFQQIIAAGS